MSPPLANEALCLSTPKHNGRSSTGCNRQQARDFSAQLDAWNPNTFLKVATYLNSGTYEYGNWLWYLPPLSTMLYRVCRFYWWYLPPLSTFVISCLSVLLVVLTATFNNVISWRSVLLVVITATFNNVISWRFIGGEINHQPVASHW